MVRIVNYIISMYLKSTLINSIEPIITINDEKILLIVSIYPSLILCDNFSVINVSENHHNSDPRNTPITNNREMVKLCPTLLLILAKPAKNTNAVNGLVIVITNPDRNSSICLSAVLILTFLLSVSLKNEDTPMKINNNAPRILIIT